MHKTPTPALQVVCTASFAYTKVQGFLVVYMVKTVGSYIKLQRFTFLQPTFIGTVSLFF